MDTRTRGLLVFGIILFVAVVFCGLIPFVVMPGAGAGVALPVIEVPGEVLVEEFLPGFNLTNTLIGTLVADIILLIYVFLAWRASKGWTKEVPGRFQGFVEVFIEAIYGFFRGLAGDRLRTAPLLWPLVATIFIFLLAANWLKLLPGVETVGKMHCAYAGQSGYAMVDGWTAGSYRLWVDTPLDAGNKQTPESEEACNAFFKKKEFSRYSADSTATIETQIEEAQIALEDAEAALANLERAGNADADALTAAEEAVKKAAHEVERQQIRLLSAGAIPTLRLSIEATDALLEGDTLQAPDFGAELRAVASGRSFPNTVNNLETPVLTALARVEAAAENENASAYESALAALKTAQQNLLNYDLTQVQFPTATLVFTEDQLNTDAQPFIFHITPFVRGAATDLSLTFALAIMSIVVVQIYGVWALGPAYFEKFINISALGNLGKKPLGAIDFVVGLIEIISEIGKIVSLAFRLFGNLFAGGVALMAVTFLVALLIPGIIVGLEIIIGGVQALVFAVLTLVFSVQAMEAHHGDDHDHAEEHH